MKIKLSPSSFTNRKVVVTAGAAALASALAVVALDEVRKHAPAVEVKAKTTAK